MTVRSVGSYHVRDQFGLGAGAPGASSSVRDSSFESSAERVMHEFEAPSGMDR
jgi:hypothetical protein